MIIVTSHWKENLDWLKKSKFPVVLIDKVGSDPSCFEPTYIIPNKGGECSVWFKYIIENYDNLPDHIAFLHGHENSYHQKHERPLLEVIEAANLSHGYIPLNGWVRFYKFQNEKGVLNAPVLWENFRLPSELKPDIGAPIIFQPNAQFIVSKERILKHPKELYEHMYSVLMTEIPEHEPHINRDIEKHYYLLENIVHIFFGEDRICFYNPDWFNFQYFPPLWGGHLPLDALFLQKLLYMTPECIKKIDF
jgi:hypothetical protein